MLEEIHPCSRCGAPPRERWAIDRDEVLFGQKYCPVCDVSSSLPFAWHRRAVWLSDHVPQVSVRFRRPWFGGRRYHALKGRLPERRAAEPVRVSGTWEDALRQEPR